MNHASLFRSTLCLSLWAVAGCASTVSPLSSDASTQPDVVVPTDVASQPDVVSQPDGWVSADVVVTPSADGSTGDGGTSSCPTLPAAHLSAEYIVPNGPSPLACPRPGSPPGTPPVLDDRIAAVQSVTDDERGATVTLDFCSPAADCIPQIGTLRIQGPQFNLGATPVGLRRGQYVRIRARATMTWACTWQVEISNAPMWDGSPNPVRTGSALLAAAAEGEFTIFPDAPFNITRLSIGCTNPSGPNCGEMPEQFALAVHGRCNTCLRDPDPVRVDQGRAVTFAINANTYVARNHRSFVTGFCDDYWNYAWTVREIWLD